MYSNIGDNVKVARDVLPAEQTGRKRAGRRERRPSVGLPITLDVNHVVRYYLAHDQIIYLPAD